jgi:hypothetical protein
MADWTRGRVENRLAASLLVASVRSPLTTVPVVVGVVRGSTASGLQYIPVNEIRVPKVDRCVCALEPILRQAVEEFYLRIGGVTRGVQARCKCSEKTLYRRIDEAHNLILGYLNDMAAGVEVRPWRKQRRPWVLSPHR